MIHRCQRQESLKLLKEVPMISPTLFKCVPQLVLWQDKQEGKKKFNKNITASWVAVTVMELQPSPLHMDAHALITTTCHLLYPNAFWFLPLPQITVLLGWRSGRQSVTWKDCSSLAGICLSSDVWKSSFQCNTFSTAPPPCYEYFHNRILASQKKIPTIQSSWSHNRLDYEQQGDSGTSI